MIRDNSSSNNAIFAFIESNMGVSRAAKLIDYVETGENDDLYSNDRYNSFPLFSIVYNEFALMFFFSVYISRRYNEMYIEFKGVSQKAAGKYVPEMLKGIYAISLNNTESELKEYLEEIFIPHLHIVLKNTEYDFNNSEVLSFISDGEITPFLYIDKWKFIEKKKMGIRPLRNFLQDEIDNLFENRDMTDLYSQDYKVIEFELYRGSSEKYVYIKSNYPNNSYIWGIRTDNWETFVAFLRHNRRTCIEVNYPHLTLSAFEAGACKSSS